MSVPETPPTEPDELAGWLERQLVGLDLEEWVARLDALRRVAIGVDEEDKVTLDQLLSDDELQLVLCRGLSAVEDASPRLFVHPRTLLELQERVFVEGGRYWDRVPRSEEHERLVAMSIERNKATIAAARSEVEEKPTPASHVNMREGRSRSTNWIAWGALAACGLAAIGLWRFFPFAPSQSEVVIALADPSLVNSDLRNEKFVDAVERAMPPPEWRDADRLQLETILDRYVAACVAIADLNEKSPKLTKAKDVKRFVETLRSCASQVAAARASLDAGGSVDTAKSDAAEAIMYARGELALFAATIEARRDENP